MPTFIWPIERNFLILLVSVMFWKVFSKEDKLFTDLSHCPCDLTNVLCDIGCCCDKDCSQDILDSFSCPNNTFLPKYESMIVKPDWECRSSSSYVSSVFCIEKINNPLVGYYFQNHSTAQDLSYLNEILTKNNKKTDLSYSQTYVKGTLFSLGNFTTDYSGFIYGQVIDARIHHLNKLQLPRNIFSNYCESISLIHFLKNMHSSCLVEVRNQCFSGSSLDFKEFLVTRIIGKNLTINTSYILVDNPCCSYEAKNCSNYAYECSTMSHVTKKAKSPALINNICQNSLLKVFYNISWASTSIKSLHITFFLGALPVFENSILKQQYSVVFHHVTHNVSVNRENRKKGKHQLFYEVGDDINGLIYEDFELELNDTFNTSGNIKVENLFMLQSGASGRCELDSNPVRFGTDRLTTCRLFVRREIRGNCAEFRSTMEEELSPILTLDVLARGRRVDMSQTDSHFVPVLLSPEPEATFGRNGSDAVAKEPSPRQRTCLNVPRGVMMEVVFLEPDRGRYVVVGVRRKYIEFQFEETDHAEVILISSSIKFTRVSQRDFDLTYKIPKSRMPSDYLSPENEWWSDLLYPFSLARSGNDRLMDIADLFYLVLLFLIPCLFLLRTRGSPTS